MKTVRTLLSTALSIAFAGCAIAPETASTDETTGEANEAIVTDHYNLVNPAGSCMDISGASTANGALPIVWPCSTQLNQAFKPIFYNTSQQVITEGKEIQLVARHSGKCLDVEYGSTSPGARIIQWSCHGGDNQRWMVWALPGGRLALKSKSSGLCAVSNASGTGLVQADCDSAADANRAWYFQPTMVPAPPPSGMTVTLYREASYAGGSITLSSDVPDLRTLGWNDAASSVSFSTGGYVSVYSDIDYGGKCETLFLDTPDLQKRLIGNDSISSLRLGSYCRTAVLFEHANYLGDSMSFAGDIPDLWSYGWNERVSSVQMSPGSSLTYFRHGSYGGECDNVDFYYPNLSYSQTGNDQLSSFRFGMWCRPRSFTVKNMGTGGLKVRYRIRNPGDHEWSISETISTGDSAGTTFFDTKDMDVDVQALDVAWASLCPQTITTSHDQVIEVYGRPFFAHCGE